MDSNGRKWHCSPHKDSCSQPSVLSTGRQHSLPEREPGQSWKTWVLVPVGSVALLTSALWQATKYWWKIRAEKKRKWNKRCQSTEVVEIQAAERRETHIQKCELHSFPAVWKAALLQTFNITKTKWIQLAIHICQFLMELPITDWKYLKEDCVCQIHRIFVVACLSLLSKQYNQLSIYMAPSLVFFLV